jgi:anti-anti-sigma regulatory factor
MSQKDNDNLIGYDPLAWMNQEEGVVEAETKIPDETVKAAVKVEKSQIQQQEQLEIESAPIDESKIVLHTTQNLQNIGELYEKLINAVENTQGAVSIDASAVTSIDTATLQLFVALKQELIRLHRDLVFDFPSEKFLESAGFLGIIMLLELDSVPAGLF